MKAKRTPETHPTTHAIIAGIIGPILAWCEKNTGGKLAFAKEYERQLDGEPFRLNNVYEWLHEDSDKRSEPSLSAGIVMIRAARALKIKLPPKE